MNQPTTVQAGSLSTATRAAIFGIAAALLPPAVSAVFGLMPLLGSIYAGAALAMLAVTVVLAIVPRVRWPQHLLALPFLLGSMLFGYLAFAEWQDDHPSFDITLKVDRATPSGLMYHFNVKNVGRLKADVILTKQRVAESRDQTLSSVRPRPLGGSATMTVAGVTASELNPGDSLELSIIYRVNGVIRTHQSRFQAPIEGSEPVYPVGETDELTPDAASGRQEAAGNWNQLSIAEGAIHVGLREKLHGSWNYTVMNGRNKVVVFDPERRFVHVQVVDPDGLRRGFLQRFAPAERHAVFVAWNDPARALTVGVDGIGTMVSGTGEPQHVSTPTVRNAPVF